MIYPANMGPACPICNRKTCRTEHLSTDMSPEFMQMLSELLEQGCIPAIRDPRVAGEFHNFKCLIRSSLQRWTTPPDNSDLLGDLVL